MSQSMSELQSQITSWHQSIYPDASFHILNSKLIEESLEFQEELFKSPASKVDIAMEAADVAICLMALCGRIGIDLEAYIEAKFEIVKNRDQVARDRERGIA